MHLYSRQKLLLSLLDASGGALGATDFQKLLFMYTQKWEETPSFQFVPIASDVIPFNRTPTGPL